VRKQEGGFWRGDTNWIELIEDCAQYRAFLINVKSLRHNKDAKLPDQLNNKQKLMI
jgi:hypothetical protein